MISLVWPIDPVSKSAEFHLPYMPSGTATVIDEEYAQYGVPSSTFQSLNQLSYQSHRPDKKWLQKFPTILFSPALGISRLLYSIIAQSMANHGYFVASIDHPYDSDVVEFPGGKLIFAGNISTDA